MKPKARIIFRLRWLKSWRNENHKTMLKTPLKSIEEEKQDCIKAFTDFPSKFAWGCHHEEHWEELTYGFMDRVNYILSGKPEHEQALRFRNFRPVKDGEKLKSLREAYL